MYEIEQIERKEIRDLETQAENTLTAYQGYSVETDEDYAKSAEELKSIKQISKVVLERRKKITSKIDEAKREVMDLFRPITDKLTTAEGMIKGSIQVYLKKKDDEAKALQAKADKEAQKRKEDLEKRAQKWAEKGNHEKAEELATEAENASLVPSVAPNTPKINGISQKGIWKFKIVDENAIPRDINGIKLLVPDTKKLGELARSTKGELKIPGVVFYEEKIISAGASR